MLDKYVSSIYLVSLVAAYMFVTTQTKVKNIHHSREIIFRDDFRFINKAAYPVAKVDAFECEIILFRSFVWTTNIKCALLCALFAVVVCIHSICSERAICFYFYYYRIVFIYFYFEFYIEYKIEMILLYVMVYS